MPTGIENSRGLLVRVKDNRVLVHLPGRYKLVGAQQLRQDVAGTPAIITGHHHGAC